MPREERQKRFVFWTCGVRGHYQRQCTMGPSDRLLSAGGPSASFMATGGAPCRHVPFKPGDEVIPDPDAPGTAPPPGTGGPSASASVAGARSGGNQGRTTWMIESGATNQMKFIRAGFTT